MPYWYGTMYVYIPALVNVFNNLKNNTNTNYVTFFNIRYQIFPDHSWKMSECIPMPTEFGGLSSWKSLGAICREGGPWPSLCAVTSHTSSWKYGSWNHCAKWLCLGTPTQPFLSSQVHHSNSVVTVSRQSSKSISSKLHGLRRKLPWFFILMVLLEVGCSHTMDAFWFWVPCD